MVEDDKTPIKKGSKKLFLLELYNGLKESILFKFELKLALLSNDISPKFLKAESE